MAFLSLGEPNLGYLPRPVACLLERVLHDVRVLVRALDVVPVLLVDKLCRLPHLGGGDERGLGGGLHLQHVDFPEVVPPIAAGRLGLHRPLPPLRHLWPGKRAGQRLHRIAPAEGLGLVQLPLADQPSGLALGRGLGLAAPTRCRRRGRHLFVPRHARGRLGRGGGRRRRHRLRNPRDAPARFPVAARREDRERSQQDARRGDSAPRGFVAAALDECRGPVRDGIDGAKQGCNRGKGRIARV
mmetsp:Transcript_13481/g.33856  ORF Transcript_13481/g.33856 Transcript_13481/m.33856 type:complete len:242 (+) Transcript_13481:607-1332(+)